MATEILVWARLLLVRDVMPARKGPGHRSPHTLVPRPLMRNLPRGDSPEETQNLCCDFVDERRPVGTAPMSQTLFLSSCWCSLALCLQLWPIPLLPPTRAFARRLTPGCRARSVRRVPVSPFGVNEKRPQQACPAGSVLTSELFHK